MTWVKICGTTNLDDALASLDAGADALGFIFTESSRRISPEAAAEIIGALPPGTETIGIVVNETPQTLQELVDQTGLTALQLHGDESPAQLREFRRALPGRKIIKVLQVRELVVAPAALDAFLDSRDSYDVLLLDSGSPTARGGTGKTFDWSAARPLVERIKQHAPVVIGGGLNPDNVGAAIRLFDPWGVEVVSAVESAPGKKDPAKLRAFIAAARAGSVGDSHHDS